MLHTPGCHIQLQHLIFHRNLQPMWMKFIVFLVLSLSLFISLVRISSIVYYTFRVRRDNSYYYIFTIDKCTCIFFILMVKSSFIDTFDEGVYHFMWSLFVLKLPRIVIRWTMKEFCMCVKLFEKLFVGGICNI